MRSMQNLTQQQSSFYSQPLQMTHNNMDGVINLQIDNSQQFNLMDNLQHEQPSGRNTQKHLQNMLSQKSATKSQRMASSQQFNYSKASVRTNSNSRVAQKSRSRDRLSKNNRVDFIGYNTNVPVNKSQLAIRNVSNAGLKLHNQNSEKSSQARLRNPYGSAADHQRKLSTSNIHIKQQALQTAAVTNVRRINPLVDEFGVVNSRPQTSTKVARNSKTRISFQQQKRSSPSKTRPMTSKANNSNLGSQTQIRQKMGSQTRQRSTSKTKKQQLQTHRQPALKSSLSSAATGMPPHPATSS